MLDKDLLKAELNRQYGEAVENARKYPNHFYEQLEEKCDPNPEQQYYYHLRKAIKAFEEWRGCGNKTCWMEITYLETDGGRYCVSIRPVPPESR